MPEQYRRLDRSRVLLRSCFSRPLSSEDFSNIYTRCIDDVSLLCPRGSCQLLSRNVLHRLSRGNFDPSEKQLSASPKIPVVYWKERTRQLRLCQSRPWSRSAPISDACPDLT